MTYFLIGLDDISWWQWIVLAILTLVLGHFSLRAFIWWMDWSHEASGHGPISRTFKLTSGVPEVALKLVKRYGVVSVLSIVDKVFSEIELAKGGTIIKNITDAHEIAKSKTTELSIKFRAGDSISKTYQTASAILSTQAKESKYLAPTSFNVSSSVSESCLNDS